MRVAPAADIWKMVQGRRPKVEGPRGVKQPTFDFRLSTFDLQPRRFVVVLVVAMLGHAVAAVFYAHLVERESLRSLVYFGSKIVVNAIPLVWVFVVARQPLRWPVVTWRGVVMGLVTGLVMGGGIVALYHAVFSGRIAVDALLAKAGAYGAVNHFFLFAAFLCVGNSAMEEYYWRWFVYRGMREFMPPGPAVVISALGFTLHHVVVLSAYFPSVGMVLLLNVGVFVGGCVWAILYERFRGIAGPWISHALVDAAIMVVAYDLLFRV